MKDTQNTQTYRKKLYTYTMEDGSSFDFEVIKDDGKEKLVILTLDPVQMFTIKRSELEKAQVKDPENYL